jgi:hypothetical protein
MGERSDLEKEKNGSSIKTPAEFKEAVQYTMK